ncbi:unnamed protein product, partial [Polarella glacialis]
AVRLLQFRRGELDWDGSSFRDYGKETEAAVAWAEKHEKLLGSDGRLVLCGYSSGGHVAALHALTSSSSKKRRFTSVVLISGIYDLRTQGWDGFKEWLVPLFNLLYRDILGCKSEELRAASSPVAVAQSPKLELDTDCTWWVLSAQKELMGLQPFESILFGVSELCAALKAKGATVKRATCGLNHWLLIFSFDAFAKSFCESLSS